MVTGVVLAGGLGTRLGDPEKCLRPVCGVPLIFHVIGALMHVVDRIVIITTPGHRGVVKLTARWGLGIVALAGRGYEREFLVAAEYAPAVVSPCDLAFLSPRHVIAVMRGPGVVTATSCGRFVGLSWVPSNDLGRWGSVEVGCDLVNVNTPSDLARAEALCFRKRIYPVFVHWGCLRPHEEWVDEEFGRVQPIVVDAWSGVIMDGHHRYGFLRRLGLPIPAIPMDYSAVDVEELVSGRRLDPAELVSSALSGRLLPRRTTWHTYRGIHVSLIPSPAYPPQQLRFYKPLMCPEANQPLRKQE